ncbi:uncharacterized protein [Rutidosis leptorrhynchoides]|uniref:uncharacterized protein n=1 Tax=Rutidosis leptorrhynchoides TaxID=125765 RepID=UPI003A98E156
MVPGNMFQMKVGAGNIVRFWFDTWTGSSNLVSRYNRPFHLDVNKDDFVADKWQQGSWNWVWNRDVLGSRNEALLDSLINEINEIALNNSEDRWECSINHDGVFSVQSTGLLIDRNSIPSGTTSTSWFKFLPRKVNIFLWRLRLDALPVRWNLSAKDVDISSIVCPRCLNGIETHDHLFFGCEFAGALWHKLHVWLNCGMIAFTSWDTFIAWLEGVNLSTIDKKCTIATVVTTLWSIWRFRNGIVFNNVFCNRSSVFDAIRLLSFRWIKHRSHLVLNWNS